MYPETQMMMSSYTREYLTLFCTIQACTGIVALLGRGSPRGKIHWSGEQRSAFTFVWSYVFVITVATLLILLSLWIPQMTQITDPPAAKAPAGS